ncbi:NAD(P)H-hydrate dehydratase, partial [Helicobacter bizzozeronii]|uniref:NAD(P)H-hydrate dehydratase n=1 Tax=Helicobacter bizzozeronii TaxID=56877 RepID=UPI000CF1730D
EMCISDRGESPLFLLEKRVLNLPLRVKQNTHKGYFGHACVFVGEQSGAGLLSALSALAFGAGLVSVLGEGFLKHSKPLEIMYAPDVPPQANAFAIGMGLGQNVPSCLEQMLQQGPCVIDADMFYCPLLKDLLELPYDLVLTPHPKEFLSLLHMVGFEVDMPELLQAKLDYALAFSQAYPHVVLLLKGANVLIAYNGHIYINTLGSSVLAKAGSGDVLSGMIAALLAQGYSLLDASIHASLAHALAGSQFCSFALTPLELIKCLRELAP